MRMREFYSKKINDSSNVSKRALSMSPTCAEMLSTICYTVTISQPRSLGGHHTRSTQEIAGISSKKFVGCAIQRPNGSKRMNASSCIGKLEPSAIGKLEPGGGGQLDISFDVCQFAMCCICSHFA